MNDQGGPGIIIGIMAKYPEEGKVKTRLVPPLTYSQAAGIYEAALLDTIELVDSLDSSIKKMIFCEPAGKTGYFENITGSDWTVSPQSGKDLGQRLENAFLSQKDNRSPVILIGSDSPTLPAGYLSDSMDLLKDNNMVFGPTEDGGFYLIGVKNISDSFLEGLFKNIRWSTSHALRDIVGNIRLCNEKFAFSGQWYDIDTSSDFDRLRSELENTDNNCKNTRLFISRNL